MCSFPFKLYFRSLSLTYQQVFWPVFLFEQLCLQLFPKNPYKPIIKPTLWPFLSSNMCCSYHNRMLYPIMTDIVKAIQDLCEQFKSLRDNVDTPKKWKSKSKKSKKISYSHLHSQSHNRPYHCQSRVILNSPQSRARSIRPQSSAKVSHLRSKSYSHGTASLSCSQTQSLSRSSTPTPCPQSRAENISDTS